MSISSSPLVPPECDGVFVCEKCGATDSERHLIRNPSPPPACQKCVSGTGKHLDGCCCACHAPSPPPAYPRCSTCGLKQEQHDRHVEGVPEAFRHAFIPRTCPKCHYQMADAVCTHCGEPSPPPELECDECGTDCVGCGHHLHRAGRCNVINCPCDLRAPSPPPGRCLGVGFEGYHCSCGEDKDAEIERLRNLSVWGTTEPVGPKYDEIERLRAEIAALKARYEEVITSDHFRRARDADEANARADKAEAKRQEAAKVAADTLFEMAGRVNKAEAEIVALKAENVALLVAGKYHRERKHREEDEVDTLTIECDRLREAIAKAPHEHTCNHFVFNASAIERDHIRCSCWKADALAAGGKPE